MKILFVLLVAFFITGCTIPAQDQDLRLGVANLTIRAPNATASTLTPSIEVTDISITGPSTVTVGDVESNNATAPGTVRVNVTVKAPARKYFYSKVVEAQKNAKAMDVFTKAGVTMGVKHYSFGDYAYGVQGINESSGEGLYWQFYFNNALAPAGVGVYSLSQDGTLEWRLEKPETGTYENGGTLGGNAS
ncbi:TPA: DUF4430 domain-containing protein [Candidatus Micrarchaeota archaeon]|nr:DUF4430 domain-containing protein [Candidatus Micrarchaeota archaeon]